jgi:hypothetical protein
VAREWTHGSSGKGAAPRPGGCRHRRRHCPRAGVDRVPEPARSTSTAAARVSARDRCRGEAARHGRPRRRQQSHAGLLRRARTLVGSDVRWCLARRGHHGHLRPPPDGPAARASVGADTGVRRGPWKVDAVGGIHPPAPRRSTATRAHHRDPSDRKLRRTGAARSRSRRTLRWQLAPGRPVVAGHVRGFAMTTVPCRRTKTDWHCSDSGEELGEPGIREGIAPHSSSCPPRRSRVASPA